MKWSLLCAVVVVGAAGCAGGSQAVYPPRPPAVPGLAVADPAPSRVVVHATVTSQGLKQALDQQIPKNGSGVFHAVGSDHRYLWSRKPVDITFAQGRISVHAHVDATVEALGTTMDVPLDLEIGAEPVVSSDYRARLQSPTVNVTTTDRRLRIAQSLGGALDAIRDQIDQQVRTFTYDLKPVILEAHGRIAKPIDLPLGDARGCAMLTVLGIEAGPTVLADGIEKDLAIVVAPSVTLPCTYPAAEAPLPPLANVASLPTGPFTVSIPVAARYEELQKAMTLAFTNGKLYFSKEFPALYMEKPEVYASKDQLVLKLHINGPIHKFGIDMTLDGDLYMVGHPTVVDNEIRVPDLEPTIETQSFLLRLKAALDGNSIRDQARDALHLDIGDRLTEVRNKLSSDLTFGDNQGCLRAAVSKIEITGVHTHQGYLRVYVALTGQASVYLPCPTGNVTSR
ncbi:MAG: hypothetical protein JWM53_342 [bacterium]|nr:hypothetical protein [bacterium]